MNSFEAGKIAFNALNKTMRRTINQIHWHNINREPCNEANDFVLRTIWSNVENGSGDLVRHAVLDELF